MTTSNALIYVTDNTVDEFQLMARRDGKPNRQPTEYIFLLHEIFSVHRADQEESATGQINGCLHRHGPETNITSSSPHANTADSQKQINVCEKKHIECFCSVRNKRTNILISHPGVYHAEIVQACRYLVTWQSL